MSFNQESRSEGKEITCVFVRYEDGSISLFGTREAFHSWLRDRVVAQEFRSPSFLKWPNTESIPKRDA